ncbi:MAG: hypothetical protein AB3N13_04370 [Arenibacterium sp.]
MTEKPKYIRTKEIEKVHGLNRWKVQRLVKAKKLRRFNVEGTTLFNVQELEALIETSVS